MKYIYEHLKAFFEVSTWDEAIKGPFGLKPPGGDWAAFVAQVEELKGRCEKGQSIKVIYAARHGQGLHNLIQEQHGGSQAAQITHPVHDPLLTDLGRSQAAALGRAFQRESRKGMPVPERWYTSPLRRAGETAGIEWGWLFKDSGEVRETEEGDKGHGVPANVVENIREHLHVHQCDSRRSVTALKQEFPSFTYPPEMDDEDVLWRPVDREKEEETMERAGRGIAEAFERSDDTTYLSVTAHSGALRGIFASLGIPPRGMQVGEMNVLVVKLTAAAG